MLDDPTALESAERSDPRDRFLGSHRALAACSREFARLADEVESRVAELARESAESAPETRVAPGRVIVQLGPVALTLSWLRSTLDSVADGQLLVVAWRGQVGRGSAHRPEHAAAVRGGQSAVAIWEESLVVDATSEQDWWWHPEGDATRRYGSSELAALCVEPLRAELLQLRS